MTISKFISALDNFAWGPVMLVFFVGVGFYLSIATGFLQFRKFGYAMKNTLGKLFRKQSAGKGEVTPLQAMTTALAATVGTGNIAGVTGAIFVGGPGAIFWMWISALVGMLTKYSEVVLAVKYRERNADGDWVGGPMYFIKNGLGKNWKWLGALFCIFGSLAAFGIGNATQVNSIVSSITGAFSTCGSAFVQKQMMLFGTKIPVLSLIICAVVAVILALVIFGGIKRIGSVTEKLVPIMALVYIVSALLVVGMNYRFIGEALALIVKSAFSAKAALGGAVGITVMTSIQKGVGRGCFSNEAGLGTAPMAHAATSETDPVKQGMFGIFEVFMDTIVICTLTSLTVLTTYCAGNLDITWGAGGDGTTVAAAIGSVLGGTAGSLIIAFCLSLFALSTVLSWALYGVRCFEYLFGVKWGNVYKLVYILFTFVSITMSLQDVWNLADALNGFMAIPNLIGLLMLSPVVFKLTREHFAGLKK